jgi:hypothetical protein
MKTDESLKAKLMQAAEAEIVQLMEQMPSLEEGDLMGVEEEVLKMIFRLGRTVLEEVVTRQTAQDAPAKRRVGHCRHEQRLMGERSKQVLTLLGTITVRRAYYRCQPDPNETEERAGCSHGEAPADAVWGIEAGRTSGGVQRVLGYLCASLTLEEAAETFSRLFPLHMSARQALNVIQPVGQALLDQEEEEMQRQWEQAAEARSRDRVPDEPRLPTLERLYVETDGVTARLRRGSVPMEQEETQRSGDVYREIKVGAVFVAESGRHRSALVPGVFVDSAQRQVYVARRCTAEEFGPLLYQCACHQGLASAKQVVVLGDGAPWIWNQATQHFPGAVQIVDLFHAKQHVWEVAHAVYGRASPEAVTWAKTACQHLEQGYIADLIAAIAALPPLAPPPGHTRSIPEQAIGYFSTNATRMDYPTFRAQGMHIGSGIAEAACKTVVSTRAKRTGMRWTPRGLAAIIALRIAVLNGSYDDFWLHRHHFVLNN